MARSALTILLMLPGAVVVGIFGFVMSGFFGDNGFFADSSWIYAQFWGGFMALAWGATPGTIVGLYSRKRWVYPIFGGAIGALLTLGLEAVSSGPQNINVEVKLYAALPLLGFVAGCLWWYVAKELAAEAAKRKSP